MLRLAAGFGTATCLRRASGQIAKPRPDIQRGPFSSEQETFQAYSRPNWFRDAKFGIWAHWGPSSAIEQGDWYARNMYIEGTPQYQYHNKTYGHPSKFGYKDTFPLWKAERFDPEALIQLYAHAGAKYFVSMGVHCDNFDLWNSRNHRWNSVRMGPRRDIVGEWSPAALAYALASASTSGQVTTGGKRTRAPIRKVHTPVWVTTGMILRISICIFRRTLRRVSRGPSKATKAMTGKENGSFALRI